MLNSNYGWRNRTFRYGVTLWVGFVAVCAFYKFYPYHSHEGTQWGVILEVFGISALIGVVFWRMIRRSLEVEQAITLRLAESEANYRNLVENTGLGYVIIDATGTVLEANQEYARLAGRQSPGEIIGNRILEWTAPHDVARNEVEIRRCLEEGTVRNLRVDYLGGGGEIKTVEVNASRLTGADGKVRILAVCNEVTALKRAEETLLQAKEFAQCTIDSLSGHICVLDQHGVILSTNLAWRRFAESNSCRAPGRSWGPTTSPPASRSSARIPPIPAGWSKGSGM
jgi:PAS domain S-box-containing protein